MKEETNRQVKWANITNVKIIRMCNLLMKIKEDLKTCPVTSQIRKRVK